MRSLLLAVLFCLTLLPATPSVAAGSWLVPNHDAQATNDDGGASVLDAPSAPHKAWFVPHVTQAIAADRFVYAISGKDVVVLDAESGHTLRTFTLDLLRLRSADGPRVLAYAAGKLVIATNFAIIAADPFHGTVIWRAPFGATSLTIDRGIIYSGMFCRATCGSRLSAALDLRTGRVIWRHNGNFAGQPVLIAGYLYQPWGVAQGQTRIFDPVTGTPVAFLGVRARWTGDSGDAFAMAAVPSPGLSWLDRTGADGRSVWRVNLGHLPAGAAAPVYASHALYAVSDRFHPGIVCISAAHGALRWARNLGPNLSLIGAGHHLAVLHRQTGQIEVLAPGTGRTLWRISIPGYAASDSATLMAAGPALYVTDGAGLIALRIG